VVRSGEDTLLVRGILTDEQRGQEAAAIQKTLSGETDLRLDGLKIQRISQIAHLTPLQTLLPDVSELIFGGPGRRRSWLDWGMFHVKPDFLGIHRDYSRVLKQRNAALKAGRNLDTSLEPWNAELVLLAQALTDMRLDYLDKLTPELERILALLVPELAITFEYQRGWPADQRLEKLLGERHSAEVNYGVTQWGPHRADVRFMLAGRNASKILSRGQGKLLATAMMVSQVALLSSLEQRASVFLIDDAGAELDSEHGDSFFALLRELGSQVISTAVQRPENDYGFPAGSFEMFHVEQGTIARE
jgi:DNA replication and repair protein RecF